MLQGSRSFSSEITSESVRSSLAARLSSVNTVSAHRHSGTTRIYRHMRPLGSLSSGARSRSARRATDTRYRHVPSARLVDHSPLPVPQASSRASFRAVSLLRRIRVFLKREMFLTGRLESPTIVLISAERKTCRMKAPNSSVPVQYMNDTWSKGVHGRHAVSGNLPRTTTSKFALKDLHTLGSLLPLCNDAPLNCFHAYSMRSVCHCHGSRVFRRRAGPLLEHCGVTHVGLRGNTVGMFYIPQSSQALIVSPSIAVFANALLAASNRLRLLAPAVLLVNLRTNALDASLAKPFGTPLDSPRVEARGTATGFCGRFCHL